MAEKNRSLLVGAVLVAGLFLLAAPWVRMLMVKMKVQDAVHDLGRYPTSAQIVGLQETLAEIPTHYYVSRADVKATVALEERDMGPGGIWRYVLVDVDYGKSVHDERRIETSVSPAFFEELQQGGVTVSRLGVDEDDEGDEDGE